MAHQFRSPTRFEQRCYAALKEVPKGKVTTYADLARLMGSGAHRAVGNAMSRNRDPKVPCHRVIRSDGKVGGYNRGRTEKIRMLQREGVAVVSGKIDLSRYRARLVPK